MVNVTLRPTLLAHPRLCATVMLGLTLIWWSPTPRLENVNGEEPIHSTISVQLHSVCMSVWERG